MILNEYHHGKEIVQDLIRKATAVILASQETIVGETIANILMKAVIIIQAIIRADHDSIKMI